MAVKQTPDSGRKDSGRPEYSAGQTASSAPHSMLPHCPGSTSMTRSGPGPKLNLLFGRPSLNSTARPATRQPPVEPRQDRQEPGVETVRVLNRPPNGLARFQENQTQPGCAFARRRLPKWTCTIQKNPDSAATLRKAASRKRPILAVTQPDSERKNRNRGGGRCSSRLPHGHISLLDDCIASTLPHAAG